MSLRIDEERITIDPSTFIDPSAIIGHKSLRQIDKKDLLVSIAADCQMLSGVVIYEGTSIGKNSLIGHNSVIREETIIGDGVSIWNNTFIDYRCRIGSNVKIHYNVYIAPDSVIEDDVFIAPGVVTANVIHPGCKLLKKCMKGPIIKKGAQIGANVTINPHITIGERAVIGSGTIVTRNVPKESFVYGNPAKVRGSIFTLECKTGITDRPYKNTEK